MSVGHLVLGLVNRKSNCPSMNLYSPFTRTDHIFFWNSKSDSLRCSSAPCTRIPVGAAPHDYQSERPDFYDVFDSTVSIVFFGAPHYGADPHGLRGRVAEKLLKSVGYSVHQPVIDHLVSNAEELEELACRFR